jgi:hypothetical protein
MSWIAETIATANEVATMGTSPAATPSSSQIGETSTPATQRSRMLSLRSRRRGTSRRSSIEKGIGTRSRAEIPQPGGL